MHTLHVPFESWIYDYVLLMLTTLVWTILSSACPMLIYGNTAIPRPSHALTGFSITHVQATIPLIMLYVYVLSLVLYVLCIQLLVKKHRNNL